MSVIFSEYPGRHERHFRRRLRNPLFPGSATEFSETLLLDAQRRDHEELVAFMARLRELVQRAVDLKPNEESQVILDLKADLEQAYENACRVADDQAGNKEAIRRLVAVIMSTVRQAAGADRLAGNELDAEEEARRLHLQLLEHPLVADVLDPESLIQPDELAATLLSVPPAELDSVLELFDADQLVLLCKDARQLLESHQELDVAEGLASLEARLEALAPTGRRHG